jgi:hypothetical protein
MKKLLMLLILLLALTGCTESDDATIELVPGKDIIEVGQKHVDEGCYLVTEDSRLPLDVVNDTVDTSQIGEYEINYHLFEQGKDYTCKRIVKIIEAGPLRATLVPGVDTIMVGEKHVDAGIDVARTDVTITVTNTVDPSTPGTYAITYHVTDADHNETFVTRLVTVLDED